MHIVCTLHYISHHIKLTHNLCVPMGNIFDLSLGISSQSQRLKFPIWGENKQSEVRETTQGQITTSNPTHSTQTRLELILFPRISVGKHYFQCLLCPCVSLSASGRQILTRDSDPCAGRGMRGYADKVIGHKGGFHMWSRLSKDTKRNWGWINYQSLSECQS